MIIHGGKTWKTLEDKMYHGGNPIVAVYKDGVKYYPEDGAKPYLTFHSEDGEFTLRVNDGTKHWDGTLEWSTDAKLWTEWPGTTTLSSSGGYLYLRGSGNTVITGAPGRGWVLSYKPISCSGNIENLLDYASVAAGAHPVMANYCYSALFRNCWSLTTAPDLPATTLTPFCYYEMFLGCGGLKTAPKLPATTLADTCYGEMFSGCWSLTTVPELPATTLAETCYSLMFANCVGLTVPPKLPATTLAIGCCYQMFYECTGLTTVPELPATTLENGCFEEMFRGCSSLRISTVSSAEYPYPYRIPTGGAGTTAFGALHLMFRDTGGPFTGTPEINTTYYTDHAPV